MCPRDPDDFTENEDGVYDDEIVKRKEKEDNEDELENGIDEPDEDDERTDEYK